MNADLKKIEEIAVPILKANGVEFAGVFGSVARGDARDDSDVDLLIRFEPKKKIGLFDYVGLQQEISAALGRKVDLIEEAGLHPYVRKFAIKDLIPFYGQGRLHLLKTNPRLYHFN